MRITAGKLRHRIIEMTNLETTRETQDKVRMAIYNLLGQFFDGGVLLDLFAGSGAMAIEGYSRGFSKIVLNDLNLNEYMLCFCLYHNSSENIPMPCHTLFCLYIPFLTPNKHDLPNSGTYLL